MRISRSHMAASIFLVAILIFCYLYINRDRPHTIMISNVTNSEFFVTAISVGESLLTLEKPLRVPPLKRSFEYNGYVSVVGSRNPDFVRLHLKEVPGQPLQCFLVKPSTGDLTCSSIALGIQPDLTIRCACESTRDFR